MAKIFLTGERGIGKSSVISKVLERLPNQKVSGFRTFLEEDKLYMDPGKKCMGVKGKGAFKESFNTFGVEILNRILPKDLVLLDELGWMEEKEVQFNQKILELLDSDLNIIGVLRTDPTTALNEEIMKRKDVSLYRVTIENRDLLPAVIFREMKKDLN